MILDRWDMIHPGGCTASTYRLNNLCCCQWVATFRQAHAPIFNPFRSKFAFGGWGYITDALSCFVRDAVLLGARGAGEMFSLVVVLCVVDVWLDLLSADPAMKRKSGVCRTKCDYGPFRKSRVWYQGAQKTCSTNIGETQRKGHPQI